MVAQQILREHGGLDALLQLPRGRLAVLALAAALIWPGTAQADDQPSTLSAEAADVAATPEPVVVIDLRVGDSAELQASRASLIKSLGGVGGIELPKDHELELALAGERPTQDAAARDLQRAQEAYGAVDCASARAAAREAITRFAALRAAGEQVTESLVRAYVYELLCANSQDDTDAAHRAATQLRRLGVSKAPKGVSEAVWKRYPPIDAASNVFFSELEVTTVPAGAQVWLDNQPVGNATVTVTVAQGEHLVAAASEKGSASRFVDIEGTAPKQSVSLWIEEKPSRWDHVRRTVAAWKSGDSPANAIALGVLMKEVGVRFAFVVAGTDQVEVWARPGQETTARRVGTDTASAHFRLGSIVLDQIAIWEGNTDEAGLLGDGTNVVHAEDEAKKPQKWWVYAGIIGAVALGSGILLVNNLADDHQRIELTWP